MANTLSPLDTVPGSTSRRSIYSAPIAPAVAADVMSFLFQQAGQGSTFAASLYRQANVKGYLSGKQLETVLRWMKKV